MPKSLIALIMSAILIFTCSFPADARVIGSSDSPFDLYIKSLFGLDTSIHASGRRAFDDSSEYLISQIEDHINKIARGEENCTKFVISDVSKVNISTRNILTTLLFDCDYELYWFDKLSREFSVGVNNGAVEVSMPVSADYSVGGVLDSFYIETTDVARAVKASENARDIIDSVPDGMSDYDVLDYFKTKILDLASYEYYGKPEPNYGDIWQLVSVFDGDPDTNVVCEGFSKAFSYLCGLYDFNCDLECNLTSGALYVGDYKELHMWNIVKFYGKNYLVDVTNSSPTSLGKNGEFFMRGIPECDACYTESGEFYGGSIFAGSASVYYIYDSNFMGAYDQSEITIATEDPPIYQVKWLDQDGKILKKFHNVTVDEFYAPEGDWSLETSDNAYVYQIAFNDIVADSDSDYSSDKENSASDTDSVENIEPGRETQQDTDINRENEITDTDSDKETEQSSDIDSGNENKYEETDSDVSSDNIPPEKPQEPHEDDFEDHETTDTGDDLNAVWGDIDGDMMVTSADALEVLRMSVGLRSIDFKGDVDDDGHITSADALLILRRSVGLF